MVPCLYMILEDIKVVLTPKKNQQEEAS